MRSIRWHKVWRDLWLYRARSLLVIVAVAVGLIAAGAVLNAWALVRRATIETFQASLPVSATLSVDRVDARLLARIGALDGIAAVRARRVLTASVQAGGARHGALIYALDDFDNTGLARLQSDGGTWPPADGGITIERSSLAFSEATLGAPITLILADAKEPVALPVQGIVRDVSLAPGWMEHVVYGYVTRATLSRLGIEPTLDEIQIRVRDNAADRDQVRRIAYQVKAEIEAAGHRVNKVQVPVPGEHVHAAQMDATLMTQAAFGLLCLIVCALLIVNLMAAMLAGQSRQIGVMKTLGADATAIARLYLAMALALGATATVLALPAAIFLGRSYAQFRAEMLNFPVEGYPIPWWILLLQIVVGCLLPVLAAAWPVRHACRMSVGSALRDTGIVAPVAHLGAARPVLLGALNRPLLLAIGNAFRRRQRMLLTLLALAAGGAVYLGAANLRTAVGASVDQQFSTQRFDFSLQLGRTVGADEIAVVTAGVPGVDAAEAWQLGAAAIALADGMQSDRFQLLGLPADSTMLAPRMISGRWLRRSDQQALVVSRVLGRQYPELDVGAQVALVVDGRSSTWTIVGSVDAGAQAIAIAPRATLQALGDDHGVSGVAVRSTMRGLASQLDLIRRMRSALDAAAIPVTSSRLLSESRRVIEDHLAMVVDFLGMMGWVMIVVGALGLASTMGFNVLERTREIGVMRAIGARHAAIMLIIQAEGMVIAVLAWLVSIPLSLPMSHLLAQAFGRVMFPVPTIYWPDGWILLRWLGIMLLVSIMACAWPARRAAQAPAAVALSYE